MRTSWPAGSAALEPASGHRPTQASRSRELAATLGALFGIAAVGHAAWTIAARDAVWADAPWPQFVLPALAICFGLMGWSKRSATRVGRVGALVGIVAGVAALAAVPASALLVESDGVGPLGSDAPSGTSPLCDGAQEIADLDDDLNGQINDMMLSATDVDSWTAGWQDVLASIEAGLPSLEAAYETMKEGRPDLAADVDLVSGFSLTLFDAFSRVSSPDQFEASLETIDPENAVAAAQATLRLDQVTRRECGIVLAD